MTSGGTQLAMFPPWLRAAPALGLRPQSHPLSHRPGLNNMKLVRGIPTPLKKYMSQWEELLFPTYGKIKNVPKHQPAQICENSTYPLHFLLRSCPEKLYFKLAFHLFSTLTWLSTAATLVPPQRTQGCSGRFPYVTAYSVRP